MWLLNIQLLRVQMDSFEPLFSIRQNCQLMKKLEYVLVYANAHITGTGVRLY